MPLTNIGANKLLDALFNGVSPGTNWYAGLIHVPQRPPLFGLSLDDTFATSHHWAEYALVGNVRPNIGQTTTTTQQLTTANPISFNLQSFSGTIAADDNPQIAWGILITDQPSQTSTSGTIMMFSAFHPIFSTDVITVPNGGIFNFSFGFDIGG